MSTLIGFKEFRTEALHSRRDWLFLGDVQSLTYPKDVDDRSTPLTADVSHGDKWDKWARQYGGIPGPGSTIVQVVIQGRSASPVVLLDLRIRVLERRSPPKGSRISLPGEGPGGWAAAIAVRPFTADLDAEPPRLTYDNGEDEGRPVQFPYKVYDTDPEVFQITSVTEDYDCTWVAELYWSFEGKNGTSIIDDGGKPLRTVSSKNAPQYIASDGQFLTRTEYDHRRPSRGR